MRPADLAMERDERRGPFVSNCGSCQARLCGLLRRSTSPRQRSLERGARLGGEACTKLWTVLGGLAALCTTLPDGRRQIVSLSLPGEVVCPVSSANVWIEALTPSQLCELDIGARATEIEQDPALSAELFRIAHLQVRDLSAHLVTLGRLDGMERVCLFLEIGRAHV